MKRWATIITVLILLCLSVIYYQIADRNYHTLEEFYNFPVPNAAELDSESTKARSYIWEPSSGTSVPMNYRFVIKKHGWKEIGIDGQNVMYEKAKNRVNLAIDTDYIAIIKEFAN